MPRTQDLLHGAGEIDELLDEGKGVRAVAQLRQPAQFRADDEAIDAAGGLPRWA